MFANPFSRGFLRNALYSVLFVSALLVSSCSDSDEDPEEPAIAGQTVFMYMPWSGEDIYDYFLDNISDFETSIKENKGLDGKRLILFVSSSGSNANLINISYSGDKCRRDTLKRYVFDTPEYTTESGIRSILGDVVAEAPANGYAMIIGCHGMGWLPVGTSASYSKKRSANAYKTRYFGHGSNSKYQTDVTTLASGIKSAGLRMKYILFDDCYMSNIETAYDLREVTDYLVASTCEVMIAGMPYDIIGKCLLDNDLAGVCEGFYSFYSAYTPPCGTIGVTDCREVEDMASLMKEINAIYADGNIDIDDIQTLDGLNPTVFFDFGDYVTHICTDEELLAAFNAQLDKLVPYKANTETYYSALSGRFKQINTFSGITISDPTTNRGVAAAVKQTAWYAATH